MRHIPRDTWTRILILLAATVAAYAPALTAGFVWDDDVFVIENPLVRAVHGIWWIWLRPMANPETHYWPVVHSSFWLDYRLWGASPPGWHAINVALHAGCALLVWRVLAVIGARRAWFAAMLFALHPVHVESVAWVIERKDTLSALFYLAAFLAYVRHERGGGRGAYAAAVIAFLLAMGSKSIAVTLPAALLLWRWWETGRVTGRDAARIAPLLVIGLGVAWADAALVALREPMAQAPALSDRFVNAGRALWHQSAKLVFPLNLSPIYPGWPPAGENAAAFLWPATWAALLAALWLGRNRIGRSPLAAGAFYAVTLSPTLGLLHFGFLNITPVADRFQYLASAGPLALAAAAGAAPGAGWFRGKRRVVTAAAIVILAALGTGTFLYCRAWRDRETLFRHALRFAPESPHAHLHLGVALRRAGNAAAARASLERAAALGPGMASPQNELGILLQGSGDGAGAEAAFARAVAAEPNHAAAQGNLGVILMLEGKPEQALPHLEMAVRLSPYNAAFVANLKRAHAIQKRR